MRARRLGATYLLLSCLGLIVVACSLVGPSPPDEAAEPPPPPAQSPTEAPATSDSPVPSTQVPPPSTQPARPAADATNLLMPSDLVYLGAFRLPDSADDLGWTWSGHALAYYPEGDPAGPGDGYPGSLFGTGNDQKQYVSEITIPVPVISQGKNVEDLNTAETLQEFHDIRGRLYDGMEGFEDFPGTLPKAGLAYLPAQGQQTAGKLYFCWGYHLQQVPQNEPTLHGQPEVSHGWCELDLADPQPAGAWKIGDYINYVTSDYIFPIDSAWAEAHTPDMLLATGRFRDGGQGSRGPSLFAYGPWNEGNPPPPGAQLSTTALLAYSNFLEEGGPVMDGYADADEWMGGAWLTAGNKSAVVFVGTKGLGKAWYGYAEGTVWPEEGPYPPIPDPPNDNRGWWAERFVAQIIFYSPADLAAVARGEKQTWEPQPYAAMDIDAPLYHITSDRQWQHVGAAAFDPQRGLLYIIEPLVDEDKSIIHVWQVKGG